VGWGVAVALAGWDYSWIPMIAPIVGGIFGAGAYFFIGF
jgi:glycerol uptake facilitator-like aquaporin